MKSKEDPITDQNLGMSRRAILKAASAVAAAGLTIGMPEGAAAVPTGTTEYLPHTNLDPSNVYPLLAAWLILTTHGPFSLPDSLTSVAGLGNNNGTVDYLLKHSYNDPALQAAFQQVQSAFANIAKYFAKLSPATPSAYGGGICPDKASVIQAVANLH
jgi:hypothetical protein